MCKKNYILILLFIEIVKKIDGSKYVSKNLSINYKIISSLENRDYKLDSLFFDHTFFGVTVKFWRSDSFRRESKNDKISTSKKVALCGATLNFKLFCLLKFCD
jgi:hypothetical protein